MFATIWGLIFFTIHFIKFMTDSIGIKKVVEKILERF